MVLCNTNVLYNASMKYFVKTTLEDKELLEGLNLADFARHSKFYQSHLTDIRNNKKIVGESTYKELKKAITSYKNKTLDTIHK